jgi:hypothetical protein
VLALVSVKTASTFGSASDMRIGDRWSVDYIGWKGSLFIWNGFRWNGGGYMHGSSPYSCWRLGPVIVKRYV